MLKFLKALLYAACLWVLIATGVGVFAYFAFAWRAQGVETLLIGLAIVSFGLTLTGWVILRKVQPCRRR